MKMSTSSDGPTSSTAPLYISAPGKIILFGEHAVVYGRTAVAGSIDLRTYVSLITSADGRIYLSLPDLGVEKTWLLKDLIKAGEKLAEYGVEDGAPPSLEYIVPMARKLSGSCEDQCGVQHLAILSFWYLLLGVAQRKRDLLAVKVTVRFKLPSCVGLGSSGAYCVCIASALLQTAGLIPPPTLPVLNGDDPGTFTWEDHHLDMIRKWSAAAESLIHGRASGLDAAVCTYGERRVFGHYASIKLLTDVACHGGVASFKPGTRITHLRNLPDLRVILVNSKVERNTSRMVQTVKERLKKFPHVVDSIFNAIDAVSKEATKILDRASVSSGSSASGETLTTTAGGGPQTNGGDRLLMLPGGVLNSGTLENGSVGSSSLAGVNACTEDEHQSLQAGASSSRAGSIGTISPTASNDPFADGYAKLNDLCRINNQLLIALGVGHPKIDQICTLLARYGIHPKMTGAGGGGSVYAFLKPDTSQTVMDMIKEELTKLDYELWQPPLGGPGLSLHTQKPDVFFQ